MCFSVMAIKKLEKLSKIYNAPIDRDAFLNFNNLKEKYPKSFMSPLDNGQIFPNYFGPIYDGTSIKPMRYRLRPGGSSTEVPSKYNVFNARIDSLEKRSTWNSIFGRNHGVIALERFYEWVEREEGKTLVSFSARDNEYILAPCLFDYFEQGEKSFYSFAIITDEPNQEVMDQGHDRQPIFLKEKNLEAWLNPKGLERTDFYSLLSDKQEDYFNFEVEQRPKESNQLKLI